MLSQPPLFRSSFNGQAHCQLLEPEGIAAVLGIRTVNNVIFQVDIDPSFVDILTHQQSETCFLNFAL